MKNYCLRLKISSMHYYYDSVKDLCDAWKIGFLEVSKHKLESRDWSTPYENEACIITEFKITEKSKKMIFATMQIMKTPIYHSIEVQNLPGHWAVEIKDCKEYMKPIKPKFIEVANYMNGSLISYIENTLLSDLPVKIIDGVNGGIAEGYIQVGFWRVKLK